VNTPVGNKLSYWKKGAFTLQLEVGASYGKAGKIVYKVSATRSVEVLTLSVQPLTNAGGKLLAVELEGIVHNDIIAKHLYRSTFDRAIIEELLLVAQVAIEKDRNSTEGRPES
jgi:hypothetical protein